MTRHLFVSFCVGLIILGATHRPLETQMIETFATSEYVVRESPYIKDVLDNQVICTQVFYTRDGYPFVWPNTEIGDCDQEIWRSNSKWYMRLMILPDQFFRYEHIPENAEPVYIIP